MDQGTYLTTVAGRLEEDGMEAQVSSLASGVRLAELAQQLSIDLLVWGSDVTPRLARGDFLKMVQAVSDGLRVPILCVKNGLNWQERFTCFSTILVGLDGSNLAEQVVPRPWRGQTQRIDRSSRKD